MIESKQNNTDRVISVRGKHVGVWRQESRCSRCTERTQSRSVRGFTGCQDAAPSERAGEELDTRQAKEDGSHGREQDHVALHAAESRFCHQPTGAPLCHKCTVPRSRSKRVDGILDVYVKDRLIKNSPHHNFAGLRCLAYIANLRSPPPSSLVQGRGTGRPSSVPSKAFPYAVINKGPYQLWQGLAGALQGGDDCQDAGEVAKTQHCP